MSEQEAAPLLRVVTGDPTPEELAAVVAVLSASQQRSSTSTPDFSLWSRKSRSMRPAVRPGFGAWRGSMMPR